MVAPENMALIPECVCMWLGFGPGTVNHLGLLDGPRFCYRDGCNILEGIVLDKCVGILNLPNPYAQTISIWLTAENGAKI
jgi:hypothetical protein